MKHTCGRIEDKDVSVVHVGRGYKMFTVQFNSLIIFVKISVENKGFRCIPGL